MRFYVDPEKIHLNSELGRVFRRVLWPPKCVLSREELLLWKLRLAMITIAAVCLILPAILDPKLKWASVSARPCGAERRLRLLL